VALMSEVLVFAYIVIGGVVAGSESFKFWCDGDALPKNNRFGGYLFLVVFFWLLWPLVLGINLAQKSMSRKVQP
jgi:hypothetical protein